MNSIFTSGLMVLLRHCIRDIYDLLKLTTPRTSGDKFLKNEEHLMSKCYLYCIDGRFFVPVLNF